MVWQVKAGLAGLACLALAGCVDPGAYGPGYAGEPVGYVGGYSGGYVGGGPVVIDRGPAAVIVQERYAPDRYRPNYYNRGYDRGYDRGYNRGYERERERVERRQERREERREVRQAPPPRSYNPMAAVQERDRLAQEQLYRSQP